MSEEPQVVDDVPLVPPSQAELGPWEGAAFMATGAALVVHIMVEVPLWMSVLLTTTTAGCVAFLTVRRHPDGAAEGRRVVAVGLCAAVLALIAYDGSRLLITHGLGYDVRPFEAFRFFGAGLLGTDPASPSAATWAAGAGFHVVNGLSFGIAYTILAGRRGVLAGIAFGVGLELVMLGLYPGWLQIKNLQEFTTMSMLGHVAYGAALGWSARRGLTREPGRASLWIL